ncbi:MAG: hypothetical protein ABSF69_11265 [Polyangiaceae bacterium]
MTSNGLQRIHDSLGHAEGTRSPRVPMATLRKWAPREKLVGAQAGFNAALAD